MDKQRLEQLLAELRTELQALYGERLERLLLFGSQARGDATPESDVDVMVVLRGEIDTGQEIERFTELRAELSLAYDTILSMVFVSLERYSHENSPFLLNVKREAEVVA
jgi:predicted nucleotidyltransferase